jgi:hypothetical protein
MRVIVCANEAEGGVNATLFSYQVTYILYLFTTLNKVGLNNKSLIIRLTVIKFLNTKEKN